MLYIILFEDLTFFYQIQIYQLGYELQFRLES